MSCTGVYPICNWVILRLLTPRPNRAVVTTLPRPNCQTATATANSMHVTGPFTESVRRPEAHQKRRLVTVEEKGDTWRHWQWYMGNTCRSSETFVCAGFQAMGSMAQCQSSGPTSAMWRETFVARNRRFWSVFKDTGTILARQNMAWCFKMPTEWTAPAMQEQLSASPITGSLSRSPCWCLTGLHHKQKMQATTGRWQ